jgi:hypothetical protein
MTSERNQKYKGIAFKLAVLIIFIAGVVFAVLFAFRGDTEATFKWDQLKPGKILDALKEEHNVIAESSFQFENLSIVGSGTYMDHLLLMTDSDIRLMNSKGEELWYYTHEIRKPVLHISGRWVLVYEQTGKNYLVIRDGKLLRKDKLEAEIAFGAITDNALMFITTNDAGYRRAIHTVSTDNNIKIGTLYIDDYYPFYAKSTHEGENEYFILYGLGMNTNQVTTIIRQYRSTLESNPVTSIELEGLYPIMLDAGQRHLFIGENAAQCYDHGLELLWSHHFETELYAAGLFENGRTVFAVENSLLFFDEYGRETKRIEIENRVDSIEIYQNKAAVISGTEATFYDASGNLTDVFIQAGLTLKVHFVDTKRFFLLSEHEAVLHTFSKRQ